MLLVEPAPVLRAWSSLVATVPPWLRTLNQTRSYPDVYVEGRVFFKLQVALAGVSAAHVPVCGLVLSVANGPLLAVHAEKLLDSKPSLKIGCWATTSGKSWFVGVPGATLTLKLSGV